MRTSLLLLITTLICLMNSCEKSEQLPLAVSGTELSDCKSNLKSATREETPDTLSCVEYLYDPSSKQLSLTHINAGFNCCPGEINCTATMSGDTIVIEESETAPLCDCDCLFDLDFDISHVETSAGFLKIIEPYWSGAGSIEFEIALKEEPSGDWCSTRKNYPWGMY